jgi:hypothetical protein
MELTSTKMMTLQLIHNKNIGRHQNSNWDTPTYLFNNQEKSSSWLQEGT